MNKEQQDLAWVCLPKELRMELKAIFNMPSKHGYSDSVRKLLVDIYGDNLTSDTEPEEMLMVERNKVQESHNNSQKTWDEAHSNEWADGICFILEVLFGDKCLPDKESETKSKEAKETQKLSLSVEQSTENKEPMKEIKDYPPYLDKPNKIVPTEKNRCEKCGANTQQCADAPCQNYPMEEKELDLYELLQDCSDVTTIYSVVHDAEVEFKLANRYIEFMGLSFYSNGSMYDVAGRCMLYPSRALYEKYPLDAYSAWMEWKEARKPKYVLQAELRLISNKGMTIEDYECVEVEVSDIDLTQAAEAVRETLRSFILTTQSNEKDNV